MLSHFGVGRESEPSIIVWRSAEASIIFRRFIEIGSGNHAKSEPGTTPRTARERSGEEAHAGGVPEPKKVHREMDFWRSFGMFFCMFFGVFFGVLFFIKKHGLAPEAVTMQPFGG